jgi:hypothetical protein
MRVETRQFSTLQLLEYNDARIEAPPTHLGGIVQKVTLDTGGIVVVTRQVQNERRLHWKQKDGRVWLLRNS